MATEKGLLIAFDPKTADRVLKATRSVESMGLTLVGAQTRQTFSHEQIIVPRSGPDGNGLYTCDIYIVNNPVTGTYTQVKTGQKMRLLPTSL